MKRFRIIILIMTLSVGAYAADMESGRKALADANTMYKQGDFQKALDLYLSVEKEGLVSGALYYNIGNAYFKLSNYARSILYYERALRLMPSDDDVINNLEMAKAFTVDKIESVPEFVLVTWFRNLTYAFSSNGWAVFSLVLMAAAVVFFLTYFFGSTFRFRKASFFLASALLLVSVFAFVLSYMQKQDYEHDKYAIVMSPVASVKGAPDQNGTSLMILHEGTKLQVIEDLSSWKRVELSDGRQGWMENKDIEVI